MTAIFPFSDVIFVNATVEASYRRILKNVISPQEMRTFTVVEVTNLPLVLEQTEQQISVKS